MDYRRLTLFVIFSFSILLLWNEWQLKHAPKKVTEVEAKQTSSELPTVKSDSTFKLEKAQRIKVLTDQYEIEIDTMGGGIRKLNLLNHKADNTQEGSYSLLSDEDVSKKIYIIQTGLIAKQLALPNHNSLFTSAKTQYTMAEGENTLEVKLSAPIINNIVVDKQYVFHRNSYDIEVNYHIQNQSQQAIKPAVYYQIVHDNHSNQGSMMMPTFTGGAYYNEADKYKKISFDDMEKKDLSVESKDGWVGLVQHYFVSAWIPKLGTEYKFYSKKLSEQEYAIGTVSQLPSISAGSSLNVPARLYSGPQVQKDLEASAPGLEYVVDYGVLTIIAKPLMWLLTYLYGLVNNWGVAIILLTLIIKALFFKLSASSYKSMAQMREVAPRLQAMKEKYGEDKQKMQQAMMELYRTEKINPMGGCLPILMQIPVFISLYWVLLGSVQLRHAPFFGWITDLSAIDPWYILPILMAITMIVQSYLNPPPTDPLQAKVMKVMPIVFSIFFFFFPAGLVLYWLVNNVLSIAQQWYITKTISSTPKVNAKK